MKEQSKASGEMKHLLQAYSSFNQGRSFVIVVNYTMKPCICAICPLFLNT